MISSFKHKGLKRLYEKGSSSGVSPQRVARLEMILADLDAATTLQHLRQPDYRLHRLQGKLGEIFAIDVSGNWRLIFRFEAEKVLDIDLVDYH